VSSSTGIVSSPAWTFRTSADSERVCSEADCANGDALNCAAAAGFSAFSADTTLGVSAGCVDDRIESGICGRDPGCSGQRQRQTANRAASLVKESVASCGHLPTHGSSDVRRRQHQAPTLPSLDRLAAAMAFGCFCRTRRLPPRSGSMPTPCAVSPPPPVSAPACADASSSSLTSPSAAEVHRFPSSRSISTAKPDDF
jgi:hypothetical protein